MVDTTGEIPIPEWAQVSDEARAIQHTQRILAAVVRLDGNHLETLAAVAGALQDGDNISYRNHTALARAQKAEIGG